MFFVVFWLTSFNNLRVLDFEIKGKLNLCLITLVDPQNKYYNGYTKIFSCYFLLPIATTPYPLSSNTPTP